MLEVVSAFFSRAQAMLLALPQVQQGLAWLDGLRTLPPDAFQRAILPPLLLVLGLAAIGAFALLRGLLRLFTGRSGRDRATIRALRDDLSDARRETAAARADLATRGAEARALSARLPEGALDLAAQDRAAERGHLAAGRLETWLDANAPALGALALDLARHHLALSVPDPAFHLPKATAMLQLARAVVPGNAPAAALAAEVARLQDGLAARRLGEAGREIAWDADLPQAAGEDETALRPAVETLRAVAETCRAGGAPLLSALFAERAAALAAEGHHALRPLWFAAETTAAAYQAADGDPEAALERIDRAFVQTRAVVPARSPDALSARASRVGILTALGRHEEAAADLAGLAPVASEVLAPESPVLRAIRDLEARFAAPRAAVA